MYFKQILTMTLFAALCAVGLHTGAQAEANPQTPQAWRLQDTEGRAHALADYRGKWVVLEWVNFSCPQVARSTASATARCRACRSLRGIVASRGCPSSPRGQGNRAISTHARGAPPSRRTRPRPTALLLDPTGVAGRQFSVRMTPEVPGAQPAGARGVRGGIEGQPALQADGTTSRRNYLTEILRAVAHSQALPYAQAPTQGCLIPYAQKVGANTPTTPDFTLRDSNGAMRRLSEFRGKWVILEWVNYDCPFVKKHYHSSTRSMQRMQARCRELGIVWLSICSSAPGKQGHFQPGTINARMRQLGATPTAYLQDPSGSVGRTYRAKYTPGMRVITPQGTLAYSGGIDSISSMRPGDVSRAKNYIAMAIRAIAAGQPLPVTTTAAYGCTVKY